MRKFQRSSINFQLPAADKGLKLTPMEPLLKKLGKCLNTKGLNERRFRKFRRLYLVYPQLKEDVLHFVMSENAIRHTPSAEFTEPIWRLLTAELQKHEIQVDK